MPGTAAQGHWIPAEGLRLDRILEKLADLDFDKGEQADVVVLVLGSAPDRPGARRWTASRPNLLNVAVSRASPVRDREVVEARSRVEDAHTVGTTGEAGVGHGDLRRGHVADVHLDGGADRLHPQVVPGVRPDGHGG
uniref:Putative DNA helicase related protein n=1 Tax=uncultured bacterium AB1650 TaxID=1047164 RepID=F6LW97_9BACT|nr:putative DNA helicase related protein [uncultured bacterium AB1650]